MSFAVNSRSNLTPRDLPRFPDATLFHRIARAVCAAGCLPRKELFESWEVARRARRRLRGGRVLDLACGHGLVAHLMLILDDSSPRAVAIDSKLPESAARVSASLIAAWPRLAGRIDLIERPLGEVEALPGDVVVSAHACGPLTDEVITKALSARARIAVLPCCHATAKGDLGGLGGWLDPALAIDATRAARLVAHGYRVITQSIPEAITPKNRLLIGMPLALPEERRGTCPIAPSGGLQGSGPAWPPAASCSARAEVDSRRVRPSS